METPLELDKEAVVNVIAEEIIRQMVAHLLKHEFKPLTLCKCGSDLFGEYSQDKRAFKCTACGGFKPESELQK